MSVNQQNLCFSVTIHKLTGYLRFTVYPQQWESYYSLMKGLEESVYDYITPNILISQWKIMIL